MRKTGKVDIKNKGTAIIEAKINNGVNQLLSFFIGTRELLLIFVLRKRAGYIGKYRMELGNEKYLGIEDSIDKLVEIGQLLISNN